MSAARKVSKSRPLDALAMGLSGLCVAHCLLMPLVFAALPFLGVFNENPLVHQVLVGVAAPVSLFALIRSGGWRRARLSAMALAGLGLLSVAAFYAPAEAWETPLSVTGAALLATMHLFNARLPHRH
ncbi:MerC domain-containing protein [Asticcacaulis sp.]|uniref:MerC domain-containing protein n=1 Tax=Asticcacaulis sp. TaxID=1872648 RepID=UPI0039193561